MNLSKSSSKLLVLLIIFLQEALGLTVNFGSIRPFTGSSSICSTVLDPNYPVYLDDDNDTQSCCLETIEQNTTVQGFPSQWFPLSSPCQRALARYQCQSVYPWSSLDSPILPCPSTCDMINASCSFFDQIVLSQSHFDFSSVVCSQSTSNCSSIPMPVDVPLPSCKNYTGKVCAGIVTYPYYLPPTFTEEMFEAQAAALSRLFAVAPRENDCQKKAAAFFCSQIFMKCDTGVVGRAIPEAQNQSFASIPFPRYPCKSLCYDYNNSCQAFFSLNSSLIPNCDSQGRAPDARNSCNGSLLIPGQDNFPMQETIFTNTSGVILSTDCDELPYAEISAASAAFSNCPFPLVQPQDYSKVGTWVIGSCALPCPLFTTTKEENRWVDITFTTLKSISTAMVAFMLASYIIFPTKRKIYIVRNFLLAVFLEHFASISGIWKITSGSPDLIDFEVNRYSISNRCINNAQFETKEDSTLCGFQAWVCCFGNTAMACWWMLLAVDLWVRIVLERRNLTQTGHFAVAFYVYGWLIPLLFVSVGLSIQTVTSEGLWQCQPTDLNLSWIPLYGLFMVNLVLGCSLMIWTIIKIVIIGIRSGAAPKYLKLGFLLTIFSVELINVMVYKFQLTDNVPKATAAATSWLTCLLEVGAMGTTLEALQACGSTAKFVVPLRGPILQQGTSGMVAFFLFIDFALLKLWKQFLLPPNPCSVSKLRENNDSTPSVKTTRKSVRKSEKSKSLVEMPSQHELLERQTDACGRGTTVTSSTVPSTPNLHYSPRSTELPQSPTELDAFTYPEVTRGQSEHSNDDANSAHGCPSPSRATTTERTLQDEA